MSSVGVPLPAPLAPLAAYRRFVTYMTEPDPDKPGKTIKRPTSVETGYICNAQNEANQYSYAEAFATGRPVGFVFVEADGFWFLDIDNALENGAWSATAQELCAGLPGAAVEVSVSGTGLHIIGRGLVPPHSTKNVAAKLELYTDKRFCALTGIMASGDASIDLTPQIYGIAERYFPPNASGAEIAGWTDTACDGYGGPLDDEELVRAAMASGKRNAAAAFGTGNVTFADLWVADADKLGAKWPGSNGGYDASHADAALAAHLAYWTGKNCERTRSLMLRSALARQKWDDRPDWLELTITKAASVVTSVAKSQSTWSRDERLRNDQCIGETVCFPLEPDVRTLPDALNDLVLVGGSHVVTRASKRVRTYPDAVREYAASKEPVDTGSVDRHGRAKIKYLPVAKLWLESPKRLSVDVITWAPGDKEFCLAPERQQGGHRAYNLWTPPDLGGAPPDWEQRLQPFLSHVEYLIPEEVERKRFAQWIGHIFQRPGDLPHTCYLMIATQTGIGRGTLASILTRALRGFVAANMNIDALFGGFNGRISQKLLATVDEVREGNSTNRYAKAETFKSKITEEIRALNPKYGAQSVEKNCCRWLMFSNHLDALPFDNNDRRVIVIANPSVRQEPQWYSKLHLLMDDELFVASVQHYFMTINLAGFNPHEPAPINDAKRKALAALESDAGRACREFKELWPAELATVADFRRLLADDAPRSSRAFQHEFERADMRPARRVKIVGALETVLIVRGPLTPEDISSLSNAAIVEQVTLARRTFWSREN